MLTDNASNMLKAFGLCLPAWEVDTAEEIEEQRMAACDANEQSEDDVEETSFVLEMEEDDDDDEDEFAPDFTIDENQYRQIEADIDEAFSPSSPTNQPQVTVSSLVHSCPMRTSCTCHNLQLTVKMVFLH